MTAQHTPGPWWRDDDGFIAAGSGDSYVTVADFDCSPDLDPDEREANKDLAILAPDLHAFARMIARLDASGDGETDDDTGYEHDTGDALDTLDAIVMRARELLGQPHDERAAIMHPRGDREG